MDTIMDMGNVTIGDIIPRVDNGINGIILATPYFVGLGGFTAARCCAVAV